MKYSDHQTKYIKK